jgi:hypothetical protein
VSNTFDHTDSERTRPPVIVRVTGGRRSSPVVWKMRRV